jgi:hypothetical protein
MPFISKKTKSAVHYKSNPFQSGTWLPPAAAYSSGLQQRLAAAACSSGLQQPLAAAACSSGLQLRHYVNTSLINQPDTLNLHTLDEDSFSTCLSNNVVQQVTWIVGPAECLSSSQRLPQIFWGFCNFIAVGKAGQVNESCNIRIKTAHISGCF